MMTKEFLEDYLENPENKRVFLQETLIEDVTEAIYEAMELTEVSRTDIAKMLKVSKARISKMLEGSSNITLRTLSDICFALDVTPDIRLKPKISRVRDSKVIQINGGTYSEVSPIDVAPTYIISDVS